MTAGRLPLDSPVYALDLFILLLKLRDHASGHASGHDNNTMITPAAHESNNNNNNHINHHAGHGATGHEAVVGWHSGGAEHRGTGGARHDAGVAGGAHKGATPTGGARPENARRALAEWVELHASKTCGAPLPSNLLSVSTRRALLAEGVSSCYHPAAVAKAISAQMRRECPRFRLLASLEVLR